MKRRSRLFSSIAIAGAFAGVIVATTDAHAFTSPPPGTTTLASKNLVGDVLDGNTSRVTISGDGHWVVYHAQAQHLVTGMPSLPGKKYEVYRTNVTTGHTDLVSIGIDGNFANDDATFPGVSEDGRYVVFASLATNLVAGDTNLMEDVFVRDMDLGVTRRVSVSTTGAQLFGPSSRPSISGNGQNVIFNSNSSRVVPGDTNGVADCYQINLGTNAVRRISLANDGSQANGYNFRCDISGDGSAAVWVSDATNLVAGTGIGGTPKRSIYVRDLINNTTELASVAPGGLFPNAVSTRPAISADGRFVVYQTPTYNLVPGDVNGQEDVFRYDRVTKKTDLVSVGNGLTTPPVKGAASRAVISSDGRYVAFVSTSGTMVPSDRNGQRDVFLRDMVDKTTILVSVNTAGEQSRRCTPKPPPPAGVGPKVRPGVDDVSTRPSISDDGFVISYISDTCNLVPEDMKGFQGVIVRNIRP